MNITIYELLGLIKVHKAPKKIMIRGFEFIFGCETTIENYYVLEETKERWLDAIDIRLYDEEEIINKWFEKNMCVSFKKFTENWEEQQELTNYLQQENQQLKERIEKAIEYMKPRFMNCIDDVNKKRYFEDYYIQEIYEILKGDKDERI